MPRGGLIGFNLMSFAEARYHTTSKWQSTKWSEDEMTTDEMAKDKMGEDKMPRGLNDKRTIFFVCLFCFVLFLWQEDKVANGRSEKGPNARGRNGKGQNARGRSGHIIFIKALFSAVLYLKKVCRAESISFCPPYHGLADLFH